MFKKTLPSGFATQYLENYPAEQEANLYRLGANIGHRNSEEKSGLIATK